MLPGLPRSVLVLAHVPDCLLASTGRTAGGSSGSSVQAVAATASIAVLSCAVTIVLTFFALHPAPSR